MTVTEDMPEDVQVMHAALVKYRQAGSQGTAVIDVKDSGTAYRFLEAIISPRPFLSLTGSPRLLERIGRPTTQTISAHILLGEDREPENHNPYLEMSRRMQRSYPDCQLERDWSAAAFWYEYMALQPLLYPEGPTELILEGLSLDSMQGDKVVAEIFEKLGVRTEEQTKNPSPTLHSYHNPPSELTVDFDNCPDLYPAVALTCERLGVTLHAIGTERLRYKESDRLEAVRTHTDRHDHRMAMALLVAGYPVSDTDCIKKSYPGFLKEWKRIGERGKGKGEKGKVKGEN